MNADDIKRALQEGLNFVETLAPLAQQLGNPGVTQAAKVTAELAVFAQLVMQAADDGKLALDATDVAQVHALATTLQTKNDALAAAIDAS